MAKPLRDTVWYRLSRVVQSRPWLFAVGGTVVLLVLATPALGLRLGFSDEGNFAEDTTTRKAYDLISEGFGPGTLKPERCHLDRAQVGIAGPSNIADLVGGELPVGIRADEFGSLMSSHGQGKQLRSGS